MATTYIVDEKYTNRAFQLSAKLVVKKDLRSAVIYNANIVYNWIKEKFPSMRLPKSAVNMTKHTAGNSIQIIYDYGNYFCCLVEHPDGELAGRTWITDVEIIQRGDDLILGVKVSYTTPKNVDYPQDLFSIPKFVINIAKKNGFSDVRHLNETVYRIENAKELENLRDLIVNPKRLFPVVVITDYKYDLGAETTLAPLIKPELLLSTVGIFAHIVHIPGELCYQWTDMVGTNYGAYNGAIRTYYKNVDFLPGNEYLHPLVIVKRILAYGFTDENGKSYNGEDIFHELLIEKLKHANTLLRVDWKNCGHKFMDVAHVEQFQKQKDAIQNSTDLADLYSQEVDQYKQQVENLNNEVLQCLEEQEKWVQELEELRDVVKKQKYLIDSLRQRKNINGGTSASLEVPFGTTYDEIPDWFSRNYPGELFFSKRALGGLKDAQFEDIELVYKCLQLLATDYRQMRQGAIERQDFENKCRQIGVEYSGSITDTRAGEEKDTYYFMYRGKRRKMDYHLKKGNSRDARHCMRIYFLWDDKSDAVVIGNLPHHLDTRDT